MKKTIYMGLAFIAALGLSSCDKTAAHEDGVNNCDTIQAGRVWTHTRNSHVVHQHLTPEEKELVKDHITNESSFGTSNASIDSVGAKMINDRRCQEKAN